MLFKLVWNNIKNNKLIWVLIITSLIISLFFSLWLNLIYKNIEKLYIQKEIGSIDNKKFEIAEKDWFFWWKDKIDDKFIKELNNDKIIEKLYNINLLKIPTLANIKFLWFDFTTDTLIFTISDNYYIDNKIDLKLLWVSDKLIDLYNSNIWWNSDMFPNINSDILKLMKINLNFWKSSFINFDKITIYDTNIWIIWIDLPIIWITISESFANKIISNIWWDRKLIKIIWYVKNENDINYIIQKYSNKYNISYDQKKYLDIKNKMLNIKHLFLIINWFIISILILFIIYITYSINQKNQKIYLIFKMLWWSKLLNYKILLYETIIYLSISMVLWTILFLFTENIILGIDISKYFYWFDIKLLNYMEIIKILSYYIIWNIFITFMISS